MVALLFVLGPKGYCCAMRLEFERASKQLKTVTDADQTTMITLASHAIVSNDTKCCAYPKAHARLMTAQSPIPHFLLSWKQESVVDYILMDKWTMGDSRRIDTAPLQSAMMHTHTRCATVATKSVRYGAGCVWDEILASPECGTDPT
jgi:hypothetical protein